MPTYLKVEQRSASNFGRPLKFTGKSKAELLQKIQQDVGPIDFRASLGRNRDGRASAAAGYHRGEGNHADFIAINFEKHRRKAKVVGEPIKNAKGFYVRAKEVIKESRWDANVYIVPVSDFTSAKQHPRYFTVII
jgi:hypothetical protein